MKKPLGICVALAVAVIAYMRRLREPTLTWGATRAEQSLLLSGRLHDHPVVARLHVLRPDRTLAGTVLDFDPEAIRSCYADGLLTARRASVAEIVD